MNPDKTGLPFDMGPSVKAEYSPTITEVAGIGELAIVIVAGAAGGVGWTLPALSVAML